MNWPRRRSAVVMASVLLFSCAAALAIGFATGSDATEEADGAAERDRAAVDRAGGVEIDRAADDRPAVDSTVDLDAIRSLPPAGGFPGAVDRSIPLEVRIPSLGVDGSAVVPVGVDGNGDLEVPPATEVGWYRFGPGPGDGGSSVLAAHIAYDGVDGVFRRLSEATPGSEIEVVLDDGSVLRYRIVEVVDFEKTELPTAELFAEDGPDRLVLITCGGDFNPQLRSYTSNTVAFAVPAGPAKTAVRTSDR